MAQDQSNSKGAAKAALHPGSSVEDARAVGGKGDFGAKESDVVERTYTSRNTKLADPGNATARAGDDDSRTSGVGGNRSGVGSSSGGDLDTDFVGVAGAGGIAASGKIHEARGPDDARGTSQDFASGPPATGEDSGARQVPVGSTVQAGDDNIDAPQGADAASHADDNELDDSFRGEVSSAEATGRDEAGD